MRFPAHPFRFLLALLALLPLAASAATYTFTPGIPGSFPPCTVWNGEWQQSGNTFTCTASASLAPGDVIAPASGITAIANAGWTLGGNNTVGSPGATVDLHTTYGTLQIGANSTLRGNLQSASGDITIQGGTTLHGNMTSSSGQFTLFNAEVNGSLTTNDWIIIAGGTFQGHVSGRNGVTATGDASFAGNIYASNGPITLTSGSVTGSVYSECCRVQITNADVSGGVRSDRNTVEITGGTISGGIYSSGGQGIIITNANVTSGDITATNVPILISGSNIGSPISVIDVENNNSITIVNSTVYGSVTAANWPGSLVIEGESDVTISCFPEPVGSAIDVCKGTGGGTTIHHYELDLPPLGLTCEDTLIPVRACATSDAPCTANLATVSTTTTLAASAGTLANPSITFTGNGAYLLSVVNPALVSLNLTAPSGVSLQCFRFEGTTRTPTGCQLDVRNSAFLFNVPNFSAGDGASFSIEAVRQDEHARKCVSFVPEGGVKMWMEHVNPASGGKTLSFAHEGAPTPVALPTSEPGSGNVALQFDSQGATSASVNYLDAGQVRLRAKWNDTEGQSSFVVKPYFVISGLSCADGTSNPGATGPGGGKFCRAGQSFSATVSAVTNDRNTPTPNFGSESPSESVVLHATQVSPAAIPVPAGVLMGGASLNKLAAAPHIAESNSLAWSEVGVISLTPGIADGDYLGAGDVTSDAVSHVGRFYPHHFSTQVTPPMDCPAGASFDCPASRGTPVKGLAYAGQPFQLTVSARNATGALTLNYAGGNGYAKAGILEAVTTPGGDAAPSGDGSGTFSTLTLSAASFTDGEAPLSDVRYVFDAPPGTPTDIHLRASESGGDGVSSKHQMEEGGIKIAQGRIRLTNAFGNGKSPLEMPVEAQLWSGKSWVRNTVDDTSLSLASVTSHPALPGIGPLNFTQGKGSIVLPATGSGSYHIGIHLGGPAAPFASCVTGLSGGAPGNAPWLRSRNGNCADSAAWAADPSARASFGIFAPETRKLIHARERY